MRRRGQISTMAIVFLIVGIIIGAVIGYFLKPTPVGVVSEEEYNKLLAEN